MLTLLQNQIAEMLSLDVTLSQPGLTAHKVDRGEALAIIAEEIARAGTAILIAPPAMRCDPAADAGPISTPAGMSVTVQVVESPVLARAQGLPTVLALAERIAWLLHACQHPESPSHPEWIPLGVQDVRPVRDPDFLIMEIVVVATGAISAPADLVS